MVAERADLSIAEAVSSAIRERDALRDHIAQLTSALQAYRHSDDLAWQLNRADNAQCPCGKCDGAREALEGAE